MESGQILEDATLEPRAPLSFFAEALEGGFTSAGIQFLAAWVLFQVLTTQTWALHLQSLAGTSSIASYWGESISMRDFWEMTQHGGLASHPVGTWTVVAGLGALAWMFWAGWRMQAGAAKVRASFTPWIQGFFEALVLAAPLLWVLKYLLGGFLNWMGGTGIVSLGWISLVGSAFLHLLLGSVFMLQWWLCRLDLAHADRKGGGWWFTHMGHSFLRVWLHPVQWAGVLGVGVVLRGGLIFAVAFWAWRRGGGSISSVALLAVLMGLAALLNAWAIGWQMRLTARFWRQDRRVRDEIHALQEG